MGHVAHAPAHLVATHCDPDTHCDRGETAVLPQSKAQQHSEQMSYNRNIRLISLGSRAICTSGQHFSLFIDNGSSCASIDRRQSPRVATDRIEAADGYVR